MWKKLWIGAWVAVTSMAALAQQAQQTPPAQDAQGVDRSAANLMVVLRESIGGNKQDEALVPMGKATLQLPNGKVAEIDTGWFRYLGDMHVRFVFDMPQSMLNTTPEDLDRLGLSPEAALALAMKNVKRVYGEPRSEPWSDLMQVKSKLQDMDSSYFLDRPFWQRLSSQHPDGVVVAVPKRGVLLYAPLSDAKAVSGLKRGVSYLHESSGRMRVSGALYLFKNDRWSVLQATQAR